MTAPSLCALLYTLCLPLVPNDFWYQLRAGWWIANNRSLPTQNLLSWGVPLDTPYFYQSWIGELVLYAVTRPGLAWALVFRSACVAVALALLTLAAASRAKKLGLDGGRSAKVAAAGTMLTFLICSNNLDVRTQTLSLLLFAVWVALLEGWQGKGRRRKWVAWACPPLMALWVNTHGAFVVGLAYIGCLAVNELVVKRDGKLMGVAGLSALGSLLNPASVGIYGYLEKFRDPNSLSQLYIQEWQSPAFNEWHNVLFLISPLLLVGGLVLSRRDWKAQRPGGLTYGEWMAGAVLFYLGTREMRAMLWFALWLGIAIPSLLATAMARKPAPPTPPVPKPVQVVNAILLAGLLAAPVPLLPWFKVRLPWPPEFAARFGPTPRGGDWGFDQDPELLVENETPVEAVDYLRDSPPAARLWNDMVYGSYMTWATFPEVQPVCDPRIELFPDEFWKDYLKIGAGGEKALGMLRERGISDVLLDVEQQPELLKTLREAPEWKLVLKSGKSRLFRLRKFSKNYA